MRKPMREFCGLKRNSLSLAVAALLYGTLPELLPMTPPAFLSRNSPVISMKPIGMMVVSPILSCSGEAASGCGNGGVNLGLGAGLASGISIGVLEARSGRCVAGAAGADVAA